MAEHDEMNGNCSACGEVGTLTYLVHSETDTGNLGDDLIDRLELYLCLACFAAYPTHGPQIARAALERAAQHAPPPETIMEGVVPRPADFANMSDAEVRAAIDAYMRPMLMYAMMLAHGLEIANIEEHANNHEWLRALGPSPCSQCVFIVWLMVARRLGLTKEQAKALLTDDELQAKVNAALRLVATHAPLVTVTHGGQPVDEWDALTRLAESDLAE